MRRFIVCCAILTCGSPRYCHGQFSEPSPPSPPSNGADDEIIQTAASAPQREPANLAIIRQLARSRGGDPAALAHLIQLSADFEPAVKAELLDELAAAHMRSGHLDLAAESRRMLIERLPSETQATQAALWLVRLYSSSEIAQAREMRHDAALDPSRDYALTPGAVARAAGGDDATAGAAPAASGMAEYALHQAMLAATARPELNDNAEFAFQRSVATRLTGDLKKAQGLLSVVKHRRPGDPWGDCGRMEAWLQEGSDRPSPKPVLLCPVANRPPRLDGQLNELFWNAGANGAELVEAGAESPSELDRPLVQLAHDSRCLYVAIVCPRASGVNYERDERPRQYDAPMEASDRVRLRLDVDRDYASSFELVADSSGRTADRAWGDALWNPEWFVAAADGTSDAGDAWIVEAAIPWTSLVAAPPASGTAWACSIERVLPDGKQYRWAGAASDAAADGPETYGVLRFE